MCLFVWTLLCCRNFQFCHINPLYLCLRASAATVSWTCFQILPQLEKSSGNLMISSSRVCEISPGSSEPLTQQSLTHCRRRATGMARQEGELAAHIFWLEAEVKGDREPQDRWWTALWLVVWWETGCWRPICSSSCRGNGLKIRSKTTAVRGHLIWSIRVITKGKGKRRRNEEPFNFASVKSKKLTSAFVDVLSI